MTMAAQAPPMQMFHCSGHTEVCYSRSGTTFYSCGEDGGIRVWKHLEDEDHQTLEIGETVRSLCVLGSKIFAGTDSNTVQSYLLPEGSPDGILCRFTAPVTHINLSEDGKKLVAGAGDFTIKVIDLQDTSDQTILTAHTAPILSVAIDPLSEFVASSSCDGSFKIWNINDKNWEKSIALFPKCSDISLSQTLARIAWKPKDGKLLAVPLEREIQFYERDSWELSFSLKVDEETLGVTSVVSWSPDGAHLASITTLGFINVWNIAAKKCIKSFKERKDLPLLCAVWNPKTGTSIAFTNNLGQIGLLEDVLEADQSKSNPVSSDTKEDFTDLFDDMADEDLLDAVTQAEGKTEDADVEDMDEDMNLDPDADLRDKAPSTDNILATDDTSRDGSNVAAGDVDSASVVSEPKMLPPPITGPAPTPLQKPFVPSSTPVHLSSRFMKWNMVGVIRCYDTDEESSIDVEFHDTSVHHSLHFDNQLNYTMADLNSQAVLLATEGEDDVPSQILCQYFASWDAQKEWSMCMPKDEVVKALALGNDFLAVGTNKRHLRIFSLSGIQKGLFCLPGPIVTMAADGQQMIVVYHQGTGIPGDQCLGFQLYQVSKKTKAIVLDSRLPLSSKATLTWLGFTAEGTASSVDSNGIVRLHNRSSSSWIPVANTKAHAKGKSDHHWIIGMQENPAQIRCVSCKGSTFPPTLPRPTPILLPFQLPLCDLEGDKGQLEEVYLRESLMAGTSTTGQDTLMKMFALSCRADREVRAAEVCKMMTSEQAWTLAIKYASRSRKMLLAEKLSEMAAQLLREQAESDESEDEEETERNTWRTGRAESRRRDRNVEKEELDEEEEEEEVDDDDDDDGDDDNSHDMPEMKPIPPKHRPLVMKSKQKPSLLPLTPVSSEKRNPFKKSSSSGEATKEPDHSEILGGSNVFDNMKKRQSSSKDGQKLKKKDKTSPSSSKGTKTSQMTLSSMNSKRQEKQAEVPKVELKDNPQKSMSPFQLWFEENKETIASEQPEAESQTEIFKLAIKQWREMDAESKQVWIEKANKQESKETEEKEDAEKPEATTAATEKKRKWEDNENKENNNAKKLKSKNVFAKTGSNLNKSTMNKLASFARE